MSDTILSVKTERLLNKVWDIMTNKTSYFESNEKKLDDIIGIYNELCKCSKAIKSCDNESTYTQLERRVDSCESAIKKIA